MGPVLASSLFLSEYCYLHKNLPTMDVLATEPTIEELSKSITKMAYWKAPDSYGRPADLFRQCKSCLLPFLHDILVKC